MASIAEQKEKLLPEIDFENVEGAIIVHRFTGDFSVVWQNLSVGNYYQGPTFEALSKRWFFAVSSQNAVNFSVNLLANVPPKSDNLVEENVTDLLKCTVSVVKPVNTGDVEEQIHTAKTFTLNSINEGAKKTWLLETKFKHSELKKYVCSDTGALLFRFNVLVDDFGGINTNQNSNVLGLICAGSSVASLHGDDALTDFELLCYYGSLEDDDAPTHKIPVHGAVLAANSNVFRAMFTSAMKERESRMVEVRDYRPDVVRALVAFAYTGQIPKGLSLAEQMELLKAADFYQMNKLKTAVEHLLCTQLSVVNATDFLLLGEKHSTQKFRADVIKFFRNNGASVVKTDEWKSMVRKHRFSDGENNNRTDAQGGGSGSSCFIETLIVALAGNNGISGDT